MNHDTIWQRISYEIEQLTEKNRIETREKAAHILIECRAMLRQGIPRRISMATEFELTVPGSTKDLVNAVAVLAEHNVNLTTVASARVEDKFVVKFLTGNEEECRNSFMKADIDFKERKVLVLNVANRPGEWVKAARCLANADVEITTSYLLSRNGDKLSFVFAVSDYEKAKEIVGQLTECSVD
jgi:hypothetical protein